MGRAIERLDLAIGARGPAMARTLTFEQTALAVASLRVGDRDRAIEVGRAAFSNATAVRSIRAIDRLEPLEAEASRAAFGDAEALAHDIANLRATG
jgi:hypothetical protein